MILFTRLLRGAVSICRLCIVCAYVFIFAFCCSFETHFWYSVRAAFVLLLFQYLVGCVSTIYIYWIGVAFFSNSIFYTYSVAGWILRVILLYKSFLLSRTIFLNAVVSFILQFCFGMFFLSIIHFVIWACVYVCLPRTRALKQRDNHSNRILTR